MGGSCVILLLKYSEEKNGYMNLDSIYQELAIKYGLSAEQVKSEMQKAIQSAYAEPGIEAARVPRTGDIPTIEELVDYICKQMPVDDLIK